MQDQPEFYIASYHEAGHVLGAWEMNIPLECAEIDEKGSGSVTIAWEEVWLWRRFRAVDQNSARRDAFFTICGQYGEMLVSGGNSEARALDDFLLRHLARVFLLDISQLRKDAHTFILCHMNMVARVALELRRKRRLGRYDLALLRMDWLANKSTKRVT